MRSRPRVVVCGTKFGRVYLVSFRLPDCPFELAGIVANGSERSRACAKHYQVPLFSAPDQLPADIDMACVVVGAGITGGPGAELSAGLMARGIHVLQEHPLHHAELIQCFREARRHNVVYHVNTHYVHVGPVKAFIAAARKLLANERCMFVDAAVGFQTSYSLFDIIGSILGGLRPWRFSAVPAGGAPGIDVPFRTIVGTLARVPTTVRIQNQMDPSSPDNHSHMGHRITIGTAGGTLTLVNTHGPVIWSPQPHMPLDSQEAGRIDDSSDGRLDVPSASSIGAASAPSYREILADVWPRGITRALIELQEAVAGPHSPSRDQYQLSVCRVWHDVTSQIGPPTLITRRPPPLVQAEALTTG